MIEKELRVEKPQIKKMVYVKPKLIVYGSIVALTQSCGGSPGPPHDPHNPYYSCS